MEHMYPAKVLGVTLLHKCNFHCAHCGYLCVDDSEDHAIKPGYGEHIDIGAWLYCPS